MTDVAEKPGTPPPAARQRGPSVALWAFAGVIVAVLIVGAVVGGLRNPDVLPADSPQGVVQAYLQALFDRDFAQAREYLDSEAAAACTAAAYRDAWIPESLTASLDEISVDGTTAEVTVRLRSVTAPGPFSSGAYSSLETFTLQRQDDQWRITGDPWPIWDCGVPK